MDNSLRHPSLVRLMIAAAIGMSGAFFPLMFNGERDFDWMFTGSIGASLASMEAARCVRARRSVGAFVGVIGILFFFWGVPVGLCGWFFAPLTCTLAWAVALSLLLQRSVIKPYLVLAFVSGFMYALQYWLGQKYGWFETRTASYNWRAVPSCALWHAGHAISLWYAIRHRLRVICDENCICKSCGYSLDGLPSRLCPECGVASV